LFRRWHRQGAEHDGIDESEDGRVGADAKREHQHNGTGEGWLFLKRPRRVAKILREIAQQVSGR